MIAEKWLSTAFSGSDPVSLDIEQNNLRRKCGFEAACHQL
jgi:hypothetical protein